MSLFPPRCFTCGKVLSNKLDVFLKRSKIVTEKKALDELGIRRECCRRMFHGYDPKLEDSISHYDMEYLSNDGTIILGGEKMKPLPETN